jgi:hypothetical protein
LKPFPEADLEGVLLFRGTVLNFRIIFNDSVISASHHYFRIIEITILLNYFSSMQIRKLVYSIGYIHILHFSKYYREIIAPYFSYEPLEYGIANENTMDEAVKLTFRNEGFEFLFQKNGATLWYEGDSANLKRSNAQIDIFFEIHEKIKKIPGFAKIKNHRIVLIGVEVKEPAEVESLLENNPMVKNPFGKLDEVAAVYEFTKDTQKIRLQIGNFSEKDIVKYSLATISRDYNNELKDKVGLMGQLTIQEPISETSYSRFKTFLKEGESIYDNYLKILNEPE